MKCPPNQPLYRTVLFRCKSSSQKVVQTPFQTHCLSVETTPSLKPYHQLPTLTLVKKMPLVPPVLSLFQFNLFHATYKITHFSICFLFETHSGTFENSQFQCKCQLSSVHLLFEQTVFIYAPSCCSWQVFAFVSHYLYCIFLGSGSPTISQQGFSSIRSDNTISWIFPKNPYSSSSSLCVFTISFTLLTLLLQSVLWSVSE